METIKTDTLAGTVVTSFLPRHSATIETQMPIAPAAHFRAIAVVPLRSKGSGCDTWHVYNM
jgi:hypothetical protein